MAQNELASLFITNHAFLIAVQDYTAVRQLQTPVNDVWALADVLRMPAHDYLVHEPLINPTKLVLEQFIEDKLMELVKPGDRVLFYFAGHGVAIDDIDQTTPKGFLLPVDAQKEGEDSYVSMTFLNEQLQRLPCRHLLLLLDCCFAGSFQWASQPTRLSGRGYLPKNIYRQRFNYFVEQPAWQVITSATYSQKALDFVQGYALGQRDAKRAVSQANSPFADALLRGLRDGAGDREPIDGLITVSELFAFIQDALSGISRTHTQKPVLFPLAQHRQGEFLFLNPKVKLHLSEYRDDHNPYRGLQAYEYENRDTFYGRERVVAEMLEGLEKSPLLIVSGDSGSGKSSVVKAGLLPELEKMGYRIVLPLRPGAHPLESLNVAFRHIAEIGIKKEAVLVIDQLEELTTQYAPEAERKAFLDTLAKLIRDEEPFSKIILTVRSDFETLFAQSALERWWQEARYSIPGFSYDELQDVVLKPMQERCIEYEAGLVETLIHEVQNRAGSLPLLSFALSELYERFKQRRVEAFAERVISWEDYWATGGVTGALQFSADKAYTDLTDDAGRTSLRHLMMRLVSLSGGETAGRRVMLHEFDFNDPAENNRMAQVRDMWIEKRLLRSGSDSRNNAYIEPAHDALVRSWRQVQEWIQQYQGENILLRAKLGAAVEEYFRRKEDKRYLWSGNPGLVQVEAMRRLNAFLPNKTETIFLERSRRLQKQKRDTRNKWIAGIITALAALAVWALINRNEAVTASQNLTEKVIESGINNAVALKSEGKYTEAVRALSDTKSLVSAPPARIDSLIRAWFPLDSLMSAADSLNNADDMKAAIELYERAALLVPNDLRIQDKIRIAIEKRNAMFDDLVTRANGFYNFSESSNDTQKKFAISCLKNALMLKEDSSLRVKLLLWETQ
ncbi:MAG: caspase family protein [Saprospiraceae bacterium]